MGLINNAGRWLTSAGQAIRAWASGEGEYAEKMVQLAIEGSIPFKPYIDPREGENATMRAAYRGMAKEPVVRACIDTLIQGISSLDLETTPAREDDQAQRVASFCQDLIKESDEGIVGITEAILLNGYQEGFSISEPVNEKVTKGKWAGKRMLKILKPKPSEVFWLEVDKFLNVTGVKSALTTELFSPEDFVHWRNQPTNNNPTGTSILRSCYRAAWMLDTVWKFRAIAMERYSLPLLIGRYPQGRTSVQKALFAALQRAKGAGVMTIPDEAMVEAITLASRGTADFEAGIRDLKDDVAIAILGGTLQTLVGYGANRGDTEVHESQSELRVWRGSVSICNTIKRQIYAPAVAYNFGPQEDVPTPVLGGVNDAEILKGLQIDEIMQRMGWQHSKKALGERTRRTWATEPDDELKPPNAAQPPQPSIPGMGGMGAFSERSGASRALANTFRRRPR